MFFQRADMFGDRRLCNEQFFRCLCETQSSGYGMKNLQTEIEYHTMKIMRQFDDSVTRQCR